MNSLLLEKININSCEDGKYWIDIAWMYRTYSMQQQQQGQRHLMQLKRQPFMHFPQRAAHFSNKLEQLQEPPDPVETLT